MKAPIITLFNNKGGVGNTSLVFHLAWMYANLNKDVLVIDLDPESNLTAAFLEEEQIDEIWNSASSGSTIWQCLQPLSSDREVSEPTLYEASDHLHLLPGDIALSAFEGNLGKEWSFSQDEKPLYRPLIMLTAFWRVIQIASMKINAEIVLIDIGPGLGAINRSALIATDYVAMPMDTDPISLKGLKVLGPVLNDWRRSWKKRLEIWNESENTEYPDLKLPEGKMKPIGYLCKECPLRMERPIAPIDHWFKQIPAAYREFVLEQKLGESLDRVEEDPHCLSIVNRYRSLAHFAIEHKKPIFGLKVADGATGSHAEAARHANRSYMALAKKIAERIGISI